MGYGVTDTSDAEDAGLFAIPALLITFRETLEAAIIVSVLLGLLEKLHMEHLKKHVWFGVLSGSALCIVLGVIFVILINVAKEGALEGDSKNIVEGLMSTIAALLIGYVAISIGNIMGLHDKWKKKLENEMQTDDDNKAVITKNTILFLSFTAVVREGIETIVFFSTIGAAYPIESLPIPAVVGAVVGAICGVALYRFGGQLAIEYFFKFTMVLLIFIGAGVWSVGMHELQEIGWFGTYKPESARTGLNQEVWNMKDCCALEKSEFWVLMRVLFGYSPNPTGFEILMYLVFHLCIWLVLVLKTFLRRRVERGEKSIRAMVVEKYPFLIDLPYFNKEKLVENKFSYNEGEDEEKGVYVQKDKRESSFELKAEEN